MTILNDLPKNAMLKVNLVPTFLKKCLQNALVNFGSWFDTITLGNP
jgi:hypothetical protein